MSVIYDPVSINASSGTELMLRGLESRINKELAELFSIGRAIMLMKDNKNTRIYWTHNLPGQLGIREVSENYALRPENRWNFLDNIVFVSEWQKQQYINYYKFTDSELSRLKVLKNAIVPIDEHTKPNGTIRLIYTSVPERGLSILYNAFEKIASKYDVELEVFSSFKIYGIPQKDAVYRQILDKIKSHPKIKYHGTVSNKEIHQALQRAHIFAYPSTFLETSCISLIEAMSAGCLCVHSDIAGLPETACGFTNMYSYCADIGQHQQRFENELERAILQYQSGDIDHLVRQKNYIDSNYSWDIRIKEWHDYLKNLNINRVNLSTIDLKFDILCNTPSDINEHLPTIKKYATECETVVEMGVSKAISSWALLASRPKKFTAYDLRTCSVKELELVAKSENIDYKFLIADTGSMDLDIGETDLLFIDTWHIYEQLKRELELHANKVKKYIIMHDTTTFADIGESTNYKNSLGIPMGQKEKKGLWPAIEEFLEKNTQWYIKERFSNNNGLTVMARK